MSDRTVRSKSQTDVVPNEPEADPDPQWPELRAETPEADAIEQRQMAVPDDVDAPVRVPPDASEADVLEQSRVVPVNDEFDDDDA